MPRQNYRKLRRGSISKSLTHQIEPLEPRTLLSGGVILVTSGDNVGEYTTDGTAINASLITTQNPLDSVTVSGSDVFISAQEVIGAYTTSGQIINQYLQEGQTIPDGLAVSGPNLFLTNPDGGTLEEYSGSTGATIADPLVSGLVGPAGLALSGNDLFVANLDAGTIGEYTTSGTVVNANLITGLDFPLNIAVSGSDIFVDSQTESAIAEYTTSGALVTASLVPSVVAPQGLSVSGGDLYVAEEGGTVGEFTTAGATVNASLITGLGSASGIAVEQIGDASQVVFNTPPSIVNTGTTFTPSIAVGIDDSSGELVPTDSSSVTLAIASGPAGGVLGGTTTEAAVYGLATFSDLTFSVPGDYTLTATDGSLDSATSPTITATAPPSDNVFVFDEDAGVAEYTSTGQTQSQSLINGFSTPTGIAASGSDLFVADLGGPTIGEYTVNGAAVNASLITDNHGPGGIAISGSDIFAANDDGTISEYGTDGTTIADTLVSGIPVNVQGSHDDIAVFNGDLYVVSQAGNKISEYTTAGATISTSFISGLNDPSGIAITGSQIFITNDSDVGTGGPDLDVFNLDGSQVNDALITGLSYFSHIAISGSDVFISGGGAVGEYTTTGTTINKSLINGLSSITGLVLAPAGTTSASATKVAFTNSPDSGAPGAVFDDAVTVNVEDSNGNAITSDTSDVTVAIATGPVGAVLGGTTTVAAVNGIATFSDLTLSLAGSYTLTATDPGLTSATSQTINILAPAVPRLVIAQQPVSLGTSPVAPAPTQYLTDFTKTDNIFTNLDEQYPHTGTGSPGSGIGTANASFLFDPSAAAVATAGYAPSYVSGSNLVNNGVDFMLTSNTTGQDFDEINSGAPTTVTANLENVQTVYALMSAYDGQTFSATFTGANGVTQVFSNISVPDFSGGSINTTGAGVTDQTVFQVSDVGGGGTGNSETGGTNNYDLTEVGFTLPATLSAQELSSITFASNGYMTLLLGVTAVTNPIAPKGTALSPVVVDVDDADGNISTTDQSTVTLAIASGPAGAVLGGTTSESAENGVATFSNLYGSLPGIYTLTATDTGETAASSSAFVVYAPAETIGGLDPNFGNAGLASHDVGFTSTDGVAVDGAQSVLIGPIGVSPTETFGLTRYNADGSIDTGFGTNGVVSTAFGSTDAVPTAVDVLANGDILVAGTATTFTGGVASGSEFAVAEFNADGSLNTSFGSGGEQLISFASTGLSDDVLNALATSSKGLIYVGGSSNAAGAGNTDFAIAALTATGAIDTAFGSSGKTMLDIAGGDDVIHSLAIQKNAEIVAAGSGSVGGVAEIALTRFLTTGKLDTHFGSKGITTDKVGGVYDSASSVVIQTNGAIVVAGLTASGSGASLSSDFVVQRYTSAGRLDRTFAGGSVVTSFGQPAGATQVVLQSNGDIIVSGKTTASLTSVTPDQLDVAIVRYTTRGILDSSFNGAGKEIVSLTTGVLSATPAEIISADSEKIELLDAASSLGSEFDLFNGAQQGVVAITPGGEILDAGSSGSDTVEAEIISAGVDLVAKLLSTLPASILGGAKGTATVSITESGTTQAIGSVTLTLQLADDSAGSGAVTVHTLSTRINLKQGQSHAYKLSFDYSSTLADGDYFLLASATDGTGLNDLNDANNTAASTAGVAIAPPTITLSGSQLTEMGALVASKVARFSLDITNNGNVTANGNIEIELLLSPDQTAPDGTPIATPAQHISQRAGVAHLYHLTVKLGKTVPAGTQFLIAVLDPTRSLGSDDATSNTVVDPAEITVG